MNAAIQRHIGSRSHLPDAQPWMRYTGRFGLAALGFVYVVIGVLAIQYAIGSGGELSSAKDALGQIREGPFGQTLLYLTGIGLIAFAVYRFLAAWKDIDADGSDGKGMTKRAAKVGSGIVYGALGATAIGLPATAGGSSGGSGSGNKQAMTAELLAQPFGQWLVGIIGAVLIGYGIATLVKAKKRKFLKKFKTGEMSQKTLKAVDKTGLLGLAAKAVVVAMIGGFLIQAAIQSDASEAGGLSQVLAETASQPYGTALLFVLALGLFCYGVYCFLMAKYRHFADPHGGTKSASHGAGHSMRPAGA
ncbi:MAG: DUF1206 domain-containing protein [Opitutales bacterium]